MSVPWSNFLLQLIYVLRTVLGCLLTEVKRKCFRTKCSLGFFFILYWNCYESEAGIDTTWVTIENTHPYAHKTT